MKNKSVDKEDTDSIGILQFTDKKEPIIIDIITGEKHFIWNFHHISMHTYGFPQMVATIDAIYSSYRPNEKFKYRLFSDRQAYLTERYVDNYPVIFNKRRKPFVDVANKLQLMYKNIPNFLKEQYEL